MCNFMNGDNDCALAIKIGSKVLKVRGVGIDDHGDSHDQMVIVMLLRKHMSKELFVTTLFSQLKWM